jgi:hypothetical protein
LEEIPNGVIIKGRFVGDLIAQLFNESQMITRENKRSLGVAKVAAEKDIYSYQRDNLKASG